jgi:hypothetical protein
LPAAAGGPVPPVSDSATFSNPGSVPIVVSLLEGQEGIVIFGLLFGVSPTGDPARYGNFTELIEPDGTISDVFGVVPSLSASTTFDFAFFSDTETGTMTVPSAFLNPEGNTPIILREGDGGPFSITTYLNPSLQQSGVTGTFQSDVEPTGVPEPSTLALLAIGGASLAGYRWRRP